jgi:hypothetical protein
MNVSNRKGRKVCAPFAQDFAFFAVTSFLILLYVINFAYLNIACKAKHGIGTPKFRTL